ncbi:AAA family ATPase [Rhodococcus sp. BP-316]|uniref:McrB family protein n=1 Tax=Rhodococcus sp. BP-316 TaxID=2739445 RepID=UPI001C9B4DD0|nr:AAA family ATPase [Rhodococcus sp. BP-316]MBY6682324.1 AAA family ATPase [Rhodococcus sp. BP-316]
MDGTSFFDPTRTAWTKMNFSALEELFVNRPDISAQNYLSKLELQMDGATDDQILLMAELHLLYLLPSHSVGPHRRREIVESVLKLGKDPFVLDSEFDQAFEVAHIRPGTFWSTRRDLHIGYLVRVGVTLFEAYSSVDDRRDLFDDPWMLKDFLESVPVKSATAQRELLLHLMHPSVFEPISKMADKELIVTRWPELAGNSDDIDRQLIEIRTQLTPDLGDDFDYYSPEIRPLWHPAPKTLPPAAGTDAKSQPARTLVVYMTDASSANYPFGGERGTWAFKKEPTDDNDPRVGDHLLFVFKAKFGPRQSPEQFITQPVERVVRARVTRPMVVTTNSFWPDEKQGEVVYPYQFGFIELESVDNVAAKSGLIADPRVMIAAKASASAGGQPVLIDGQMTFASPVDEEEDTLPIAELLSEFADATEVSGLNWGSEHDHITGTLIASLLTKRFAILSGLSGSGKTRLAIALGQWLGGDRYRVVPVRPDWTSPDATLGYRDGLMGAAHGKERWHVPEVLEFLMRARSEPTMPFILLLDEMNLAHVERYFAEMLSGIESGERVVPNLLRTETGWEPISEPSHVAWPQNVFVIGTVNADETTYAFSPKVLDRANTIEFRVASDALQAGLGAIAPVQPASAATARSFQVLSESDSLLEGSEKLQARLRELHKLLAEYNFEFGHRVFQEAVRFRWFALEGRLCDTDAEVLDIQMMQKILPRIHGAQRRVQKLLDGLYDFSSDQTHTLPRTMRRIDRMRDLLHANHFVSFTD